MAWGYSVRLGHGGLHQVCAGTKNPARWPGLGWCRSARSAWRQQRMHARAGRHRLFALACTVPAVRKLNLNMARHIEGRAERHAVDSGDLAIGLAPASIHPHKLVSAGLNLVWHGGSSVNFRGTTYPAIEGRITLGQTPGGVPFAAGALVPGRAGCRPSPSTTRRAREGAHSIATRSRRQPPQCPDTNHGLGRVARAE